MTKIKALSLVFGISEESIDQKMKENNNDFNQLRSTLLEGIN